MVLVVLLFPINSSMSVGESRQSPWKSYANAVANIRRSTPLKLCQISDFLCVSRLVRWILVVLPTVYYSILEPIKQIFTPFSWIFQPLCIKNSFIFQDILQAGESNFHMVEYRIIDNISQWLNFQASSTLWSRQLHFVIVLQSLAVQVAFQFIGMKYLLCRAEQECEKMMSWGSRQAWKKFELSLISGMAAFSLSFDARSQSLLLLPSKQFFTVDRAASLLMSTRVYPITESSVLLAVCCPLLHESREKKEGELARELNFTCVRVYILWNWNRGSRKRGGGGVLSLNPKFQVGTLLSDAVLFHDSSSIPPYLLWPADRHS